MKKFISKTWGSLTESEKAILLQDVNCVDGATGNEVHEGECIIDLTTTMSISGKIVDDEIIISDDAVIYQSCEPKKLSLDNGIHFVDLGILDEVEEEKIVTYWDSIIGLTDEEAREKTNVLTDSDCNTLEEKIEWLKDYLSIATDDLILG